MDRKQERFKPYEKSKPESNSGYKVVINHVKASVSGFLSQSWIPSWLSSTSECVSTPQSSQNARRVYLSERLDTAGTSSQGNLELSKDAVQNFTQVEKFRTSSPAYTPFTDMPVHKKHPVEFFDNSSDTGDTSFKNISQQPATSSKRPRFSASALPIFNRSSTTAHTSFSVFYPGKTIYGGASNYRKPKHLSSVKLTNRTNVQGQSTQAQSCESDGLSLAAKRILQSLDKLSTPLSEAKRIPTQRKMSEFLDAPIYISDFHKHRPSLRSEIRTSPVQSSSSPNKPYLKKNLVSFLNKQSLASSKSIPSEHDIDSKVVDVPTKDIRTDEQETSIESKRNTTKISSVQTPRNDYDRPISSCSFKMTTKKKSSRNDHELVNNSPLPHASESLPIKSLPKLDFYPFKPQNTNPERSADYFDLVTIKSNRGSVVSKEDVDSELLKINNYFDLEDFIFSMPEKVDCSSSLHEQVQSNFTFSIPRDDKDLNYSKPNPEEKSELPNSKTWECDICLIINKPTEINCIACQTRRKHKLFSETESKNSFLFVKPNAKKPMINGFGFLFGKAEGQWTCDVCLIDNTKDDDACIACATKKPGS